MSKLMSALGREIIVEFLRRVLATGLAYMGVDAAGEGYGTVAVLPQGEHIGIFVFRHRLTFSLIKQIPFARI